MLITSPSPSLNHQSCFLTVFLHYSQSPKSIAPGCSRLVLVKIFTLSEQIHQMCSLYPMVPFDLNSSCKGVLGMGAGFLPALLSSPKLKLLSFYLAPTLCQMAYWYNTNWHCKRKRFLIPFYRLKNPWNSARLESVSILQCRVWVCIQPFMTFNATLPTTSSNLQDPIAMAYPSQIRYFPNHSACDFSELFFKGLRNSALLTQSSLVVLSVLCPFSWCYITTAPN